MGKTHLAIGIGQKAIEAGYRVLFRNALHLVEELEIAVMKGELKKTLQKLAKVDALVIDELGYLPMSAAGALRAVPTDQPILRVPVADHHHQQGLHQLGGVLP
ncbi:hypothetical protein HHA01_14980 [Halomonas halmophila]|uniref:IstB-like ATP-binding domain-containing protein n=1 Tax=Halomonas halmophila TaxID=252 RepID=A0A4Y4F5Y0_9GAMM|nr:hypothetical protein HHA01_14980 [Halomonas halmophila]